MIYVFFFKQKTAYEMRISDWSSDVCSSDLFSELYIALQQGVVDGQENPLANIASSKIYEVTPYISLSAHKWESTPFFMSKMALGRIGAPERAAIEIGRATCRERVCQYV